MKASKIDICYLTGYQLISTQATHKQLKQMSKVNETK